MSALSRGHPKRLVSLLLQWIDRATAALGRLRLGAFGWPLAVGIGLGAGMFGIFQPKFAETVSAHRATTLWMRAVLGWSGAAVVVVTLGALAFAWVRRRRSGTALLDGYSRALKSVAFLSALPLVVALRESIAPNREWLTLGFITTAAGLVVYSTYQAWPLGDPATRARPVARVLLVAVIAAVAAVFTWRVAALGFANHLAFNTGRADLGVYVSRFREATEGHLLGCSLCTSRHVYAHLEPIVALLAPAYLLNPSAQTLILLQALVLASGAIAVFFLSERSVGSVLAVALAIAYLAYPPLHELALYDFHAVACAVPLSLWLLYALETDRVRTYTALCLVLLSVREDMGFVLAAVGVYALGSPSLMRRRMGWATLGLAVFALIVMHFAAPDGVLGTWHEVVSDFTVRRRSLRPTTSPELSLALVQRIFSEVKVLHATELLAPLLLLPLLSRGRALLVYGGVLALLAAGPFPASSNAHQVALLIPFLFALTARALEEVLAGRATYGPFSGPGLGRALTLGVLVCSLLDCCAMGPLFSDAPFRAGPRILERKPTKEQVALDAKLREASASWPKGTKVSASNILLPHLGSASHLYTLDDRSGTDYVVAFMKQRTVARRIETEETAGQLARVASFGDVNVYRARYRAALSRQARQLDDE